MTASAGAEPLCVPMGFMEQKAKRINNLDCRRAERLGVGLLLCAALLLPALPAFGKIPFKRRPKTAAAPKKPTAAPVKKAAASRKTKAAPVKRAAAPVVTAPAAEIPVVAEPAAIWQGCLQAGDVSGLASRLQLEENQLRRVLSTRELLPLGGSSACLPYVGATGGERGAATAMFHAPSRPAAAPVTEGEKPSLLVVSRTADSVAVIGREFRCPAQARRMVSFPAADFAERSAELLAEVPAPVRWQIDVLVPQMLPEGDGYTVRVGFGQEAEGEREHLHSIEILEAASGKLVDGAWWVERKTGPGVIVGMKGTAYERALWLSPIEFIRKSRGVGPTARTVRRNFAAPPAKGGAKPGTRLSRIVTLRGFHLGVDLTAPTGTPIHAVGDGVVSFVGRKGGYGNLVIVDHGQGYQTYYAHMSAFQAGVKKGTAVTRGEVIGRVGSTGRSTAPHLHFETRKDSKYIDPYDETRQLDFWMLSAEEHERVALQLLAGSEQAPTAAPVAAGGGGGQ